MPTCRPACRSRWPWTAARRATPRPADDRVGPLTIPVAAANAFHLRGQLTDVRGDPVARAKVVITGAVRTRPPAAPPAGAEQQPPALIPADFRPAELEAVFTDAAGR